VTLMLDLSPELESRLKNEAATHGVAPEEYAKRILQENLPEEKAAPGNSLQQLFAQWDAEDATTDPEELARRQRDWEELKAALNRNRGGAFRKPFP